MRSNPACWPLALAAVFNIAANVLFVGHRLFLPYPVSPWEAGLVTEAWRMLHGLPVYGAVGEHATTMYGPLQTVLLAGIFEFTGETLLAGRLINTIAGIAVVLAIAVTVTRREWLALMVAVALLLSINGWTGYYFVETRPDLVSAAWTVAGLVVLYRGAVAPELRSQLVLTIVGSLLILTGAMFKQTALAFVGMPVVAQLFLLRFDRRLAIALIPPALGVIGVLALSLSPGLWHFMVKVPAQYRLYPTGYVDNALALLSLPLFIAALLHWLLTDARDNWHTPLVRWLLAGLVCAIGSALLAAAKDGASANTLIPALLAIGAFCSWRVGVALDLLRGDRPLAFRLAAGTLLAALLLAHVFRSSGPLSAQMYNRGHGTAEYAAMIDAVRKLPGKVVSFDDPWIALKAKGYAGTTMVFEADAVKWDRNQTQALRKELTSADYVVTIRGGTVSGDPDWWLKEQVLYDSGFTPMEIPNVRSSVYQLWSRERR